MGTGIGQDLRGDVHCRSGERVREDVAGRGFDRSHVACVAVLVGMQPRGHKQPRM